MILIYTLIIILVSVIIHEYMHGWMAERLGDQTAKNAGRLTLNPIAHIDPWGSLLLPFLLYIGTGGGLVFGYAKPVPINPHNLRDVKYGSAKVAAAGPLSNLAVAVFFGLILRFFWPSILAIDENLVAMFTIIVQINLVLMVFNLVPIPPLDGSRIIEPFLPYNLRVKWAELEKYGMLLILFFIMFGFSIIIPIIVFLFNLIVGV